jgi:F0F1-type ATP synthase membrane subunit b/b'
MSAKVAKAAAIMKRGQKRVIKARLTKRGQNTMKQFVKQAQRLTDDIEVGKRSFPDNTVRKAIASIMSSLEDNLEALKVIAEDAGDQETVEIIEDMIGSSEGHSEVDSDPSEHGEFHEEEPEAKLEVEVVDLGEGIDETAM